MRPAGAIHAGAAAHIRGGLATTGKCAAVAPKGSLLWSGLSWQVLTYLHFTESPAPRLGAAIDIAVSMIDDGDALLIEPARSFDATGLGQWTAVKRDSSRQE